MTFCLEWSSDNYLFIEIEAENSQPNCYYAKIIPESILEKQFFLLVIVIKFYLEKFNSKPIHSVSLHSFLFKIFRRLAIDFIEEKNLLNRSRFNLLQICV